MATKQKIANPDIVTATDTASTEVEFSSGIPASDQNAGSQRAIIKVLSGSFMFGVGQAPSNTSPLYTADDDVPPFPFENGKMNIFYIATGSGNTFSFAAV